MSSASATIRKALLSHSSKASFLHKKLIGFRHKDFSHPGFGKPYLAVRRKLLRRQVVGKWQHVIEGLFYFRQIIIIVLEIAAINYTIEDCHYQLYYMLSDRIEAAKHRELCPYVMVLETV